MRRGLSAGGTASGLRASAEAAFTPGAATFIIRAASTLTARIIPRQSRSLRGRGLAAAARFRHLARGIGGSLFSTLIGGFKSAAAAGKTAVYRSRIGACGAAAAQG